MESLLCWLLARQGTDLDARLVGWRGGRPDGDHLATNDLRVALGALAVPAAVLGALHRAFGRGDAFLR
jgi:hypothetical protein